ncbi:MAG: serine/threonine-protein kinase [Planctomycetota bacterium]|nr:serine/threonine-protein kinase [Planctomycetota bacterium]
MITAGTKFGPFVVEQKLGSGATGTVYRAHSIEGNKTVAIKVLAPELAKDKTTLLLFGEEAKVGLQLSHPNIVQTFYVGRHGDLPYIVFEFVHGLTLQSMLRGGPLPEGHCLWILRQLGQALRQLRQKGIVHQDIKPDNIMIDGHGNAKLTDLGLAKVTMGRVNWAGVAAGTALYMSPEQALGQKDVDWRADIYSLGATLYHAATGTPPFYSENEEELLRMHVEKRAESALVRNPKLNPDFAAILARMLEKDRQWRFQHPEELLLSLRLLDIAPTSPFVGGSTGIP